MPTRTYVRFFCTTLLTMFVASKVNGAVPHPNAPTVQHTVEAQVIPHYLGTGRIATATVLLPPSEEDINPAFPPTLEVAWPDPGEPVHGSPMPCTIPLQPTSFSWGLGALPGCPPSATRPDLIATPIGSIEAPDTLKELVASAQRVYESLTRTMLVTPDAQTSLRILVAEDPMLWEQHGLVFGAWITYTVIDSADNDWMILLHPDALELPKPLKQSLLLHELAHTQGYGHFFPSEKNNKQEAATVNGFFRSLVMIPNLDSMPWLPVAAAEEAPPQ